VSISKDEYYVFVENKRCNQERVKTIQRKKDRAKLANIK
jgi:hypothetical protein